MKYALFVLGLFSGLFFAYAAVAAPGPTYFMIHPKQKQFGEFFTGDEFSSCSEPKGWERVKEFNTIVFKTDIGQCAVTLDQGLHYSQAPEKVLQECARQLGMKAVLNVSELPHTPMETIKRENESKFLKCFPMKADGMAIDKDKKILTSAFYFFKGGEKFGCSLKGEWTTHYPKTVQSYGTSLGRCEAGQEFKSCGIQQGLKDIGSVKGENCQQHDPHR